MIHEKNISDRNGFMLACENGHLNIVEFLVENNCHEYGFNGFLIACKKGHLNDCRIFS